MNTRVKVVVVLVVGCGLLALIAGCASRSATSTNLVSSRDGQTGGAVAPGASSVAPEATTSSKSSGAPAAPTVDAQRMVIANASMDVQVKDLDKSVEQIRAVVASAGGTVAELAFTRGSGATPAPLQSSGSSATRQPSTASMTLRIPAAKLAETEKRVGAMGDVLAQTAEESDVTQQHVDMAARIANLQAEEARLRTMLAAAKNVNEMLAVERELARVQGDIESMQAQLAYLERQAAQATLSLKLVEPGALVRPGSGGWGFGSAVTSGVQAAAAIVRVVVAATIALSPLVLAALIVWAVVRLIRRRRRAARSQEPTSSEPS